MQVWTELARATTAAGDEILLRRRGATHEIRFNGIELMSNLMWRSEAVLAERSLRRHGAAAPKLLIGGLGMGYTLRAALDQLAETAEVTVCELIPAIGDWNHGPLAMLAGHPLADPRVTLEIADVMALMEARPQGFDVILLDTDNGPDFTVREENTRLYDASGLAAVAAALRPGGLAAFWSAEISEGFEARLDAEGWDWSREDVQLPGGRVDAFHHIYYATPRAEAAVVLRKAA